MIRGFIDYVASYLYKAENKINDNNINDHKDILTETDWDIFIEPLPEKSEVKNEVIDTKKINKKNKKKINKEQENLSLDKSEIQNDDEKEERYEKKLKEWKEYVKKFTTYESKQKKKYNNHYNNYNERNIQNRYNILQPKRKQS
jgi:hypothetical protein